MSREDGQAPLVGADRTIGAIISTLSHPNLHGALVVGEAGTGKSAITRRLVPVLEAHQKKCFVVRATASLADVPYGSLGPYLTEATPQTLASSLSALRALVAYFRAASGGREAVVVVDDAHYLDDDSSHILTQLVISRTIKVVLFSNGLPPRSGDLFSLYTDGFISRVDVGGLTDTDAEKLSASVLGGPLARGAAHYLARQSAGNPLMLRALLEHSSATGELVERSGVWCLSGRFHPPIPALVDLGKTLLQGLSEQERTVYEAVALSGGLPQARLARLGEDAVAQQLLRRGLLRNSGTSAAPVRVAHPMMTRVVRALVPAGRSAELRRSVFDDGEVVLPALHEGRLDYLNWALDCGVDVPAPVLLRAARTAAHVSSPESSLRFAGAARAGGEDDAATVEEARVRINLGDHAVAVDMLEKVRSAAVRPMTLVDAAVLTALACVRRGEDPSRVHAIADSCTARLEAVLPDRAAAEPDAAGEAASKAVALLHVFGWILEGQYAAAQAGLDVLNETVRSADSAVEPRLPVLGRVFRGAVNGALGRCGTAIAELRAALEEVEGSAGDLEHLRPQIAVEYVSALIHAGEFAAAADALDEYRQRPVVSLEYLSGPLAALEAVLEARRGRFRTALQILEPALVSLRRLDTEMLLPYALGVASWAANSLGEKGAAKAFEEEFKGVSSTGSRALLLLGRAFLAAGGAGTPGEGSDLTGLQGLAEAARSAPYPSCEKDTLELLLVLGDTARAWRLAELADQFEGTEAEVLSRYAHALADSDAEALLMAADDAESIQKLPLAADASARAMRLFDEKGDGRSRRLALRAVRRRQSLLEGLLPHEEGDARTTHELTGREWEIAKMAAEGATNRAIARALVLSTRTVEGHLYRIYGKLGITTREELAGEMAGDDGTR